jgi:hypothetical protein
MLSEPMFHRGQALEFSFQNPFIIVFQEVKIFVVVKESVDEITLHWELNDCAL